MAIAAETERLMLNWSRWKTGAPIGLSVSSAYELEGRGRREEAPIPLLNGEAMDVDQAVQALDGELYHVIEQHWLKSGNVAEKARRCHCSEATYYRRLEEAHGRVHTFLDALKAEHRRQASDATQALMRPLCVRCNERHWLREPCSSEVQNPLSRVRGNA